jgi:hypothetical protein
MPDITAIPAPAGYPEPITAETDGTLLDGYSGAIFSADRAYRYVLTRTWDQTGPVMTWIGLNPSKAGAAINDNTARRFMGFARREGCGGISALNLFGLIATDPRDLAGHPDPVGLSNDRFIDMHARPGSLAVAAWGAHPMAAGRAREVSVRLTAAGVQLMCIGVTAKGEPRHPLYARSDAPLIPWEAPS